MKRLLNSKFILAASDWQIFFAFILSFSIILGITIPLLMIFNFSFHIFEIIYVFFSLIGYSGYPFLVGYSLHKHTSILKQTTEKEFNSFIIYGIVWIPSHFISVSFDNSVILKGIFGVIGLYAMIRFISFPARTLRSIELGRKAGIWEYFIYCFNFLWWPLGAWWVQPRINQVSDRLAKLNRPAS